MSRLSERFDEYSGVINYECKSNAIKIMLAGVSAERVHRDRAEEVC